MKNPFRKTPMPQLETTIASLTKRGEQLAAKRVSAQNALDEAMKTRQQALLSGDIDDQRTLDKVQTAVVTATSDLAGVDDALAILAQHRAEAEVQLATERDRIERAAAADKLSKRVAAIEAALPGYLASPARSPMPCPRSDTGISSPARWLASFKTRWARSKSRPTSRSRS
jgi:hypothetical protein